MFLRLQSTVYVCSSVHSCNEGFGAFWDCVRSTSGHSFEGTCMVPVHVVLLDLVYKAVDGLYIFRAP